jgi:hypothetical protein
MKNYIVVLLFILITFFKSYECFSYIDVTNIQTNSVTISWHFYASLYSIVFVANNVNATKPQFDIGQVINFT